MEKFDFDIILKKLTTECTTLPRVIGNIVEREFKENFVRQGFMNGTLNAWPEVQRRTDGTRAWKNGTYASRGNPILHGKGSGKLRHSIQVTTATMSLIKVETIGDEVNNYARVHNDGLHSGRGKGFTMPRRQFMGNSVNLDKKVMDRLQLEIDKVFL